MAKIITKGKRKRFVAAASIALTLTFSLGIFAACGGTEEPGEEEEPAVSMPTDTQTIKNGNFEFFTEMTEDTLTERRELINSPSNWTITTVSPSSDTKSGIIDTKSASWDYLAKSGIGREFTDIADAYAHWNDENVSAYDRLKFIDRLNTAKTDEAPDGLKEDYDALAANSEMHTFFEDFRSGGSEAYSIDYEDVKDLNGDFPEGVSLREEKTDDTHVLMIHNTETSDGVLGTAVYATSSTTLTLKGGTAAKVSVWVRTDKLTHYYTDQAKDENDNYYEAEKDCGAYIAVTNTVGSNSSSPQFIVKNINTKGAWEEYTIYIRANTFATTTYRLVVGLGRNTSSDNRLEAVNGYAFFDDISAETISDAAFKENTASGENLLPEEVKASLNSTATERIKDATALAAQKKEDDTFNYTRTFAFDLFSQDDFEVLAGSTVTADLTEETSGARTVPSKVGDNRTDGVTPAERQSIAEATTYAALKARATAGDAQYNGYLQTIFENDFDGKFPFYEDDGTTVAEDTDVIMLLSTNGAAYTAKMTNAEFSLAKNEYMLISFFVKTSEIRTGKTGAAITLVDGENRTTITAFDSTTVETVDIDKEHTDIYNGWVQCFFIVKNETEDSGFKTFSLEFTYGPTSIVSSAVSDYADGYAAFADFRFMPLSKTQAGYASTGNYAKSVSLTEYTKDATKFDDAAASYNIENGLANPANFKQEGFTQNDPVYSGLLNAEYKTAYYNGSLNTKLTALKEMPLAKDSYDGTTWWNNLFGDTRRAGRVATQPLVIYNSDGTSAAPSHGYSLKNFSNSISANSTQLISMRLKISAGLNAYVYLYDYSEPKSGLTNGFKPTVPAVTYWYDDEGNITKGDPAAEGFNRKTDILYYLQDNGLYTAAGATGAPVYYANLHNFDTDDNGNLVTGGANSQIVYFRNENDADDTAYYAYRTGEEGNYTYSQAVRNLPLTDGEGNSITRYEYDVTNDFSQYGSMIMVRGTDKTADTWVEVSFYIRTGNEQKTYSLAVWAGVPGNAVGIPANGYLFIDNYKNESTSDFDAIRSDRVSALADDPENLVDPADAESNLKEAYALYYTYSFFDSDRFVRYDKTQDETNLGSPWIDYVQSAYSEDIAWLKYETLDAEKGLLGSELFLDYAVSEVEVAEHVYDTGEDAEEEEEEADTGDSSTNVWLIVSSALLAVVLIFAIVAVIVRKLYKKRNKAKIKLVKDKPAKKQKAKKEPAAAASEPERTDEDDPYNE